MHQYAPLDAPEYVRSFLDHWRPDLAVFTESEIWPNLILESSARDIPLALVNARMTKRSFRRWRRNPSVARPLFSRFALVLAQNENLAHRFKTLGAASRHADRQPQGRCAGAAWSIRPSWSACGRCSTAARC